MSLEAWGDGGEDTYYTADEMSEMTAAAFEQGLQAMREMLARFVEQGGDAETANSIRLNWRPTWGDDPGRPEAIRDEYDG